MWRNMIDVYVTLQTNIDQKETITEPNQNQPPREMQKTEMTMMMSRKQETMRTYHAPPSPLLFCFTSNSSSGMSMAGVFINTHQPRLKSFAEYPKRGTLGAVFPLPEHFVEPAKTRRQQSFSHSIRGPTDNNKKKKDYV